MAYHGILDLSNSFCLQWGNYELTTKDTETFPTTFTTFYGIATTCSTSSGSLAYPNVNRFPYTMTTSGFSHAKVSAGSGTVYYIATGKKN